MISKTVLFAPLLILCSCTKDKAAIVETETPDTYLHLSHTRLNSNPYMDSDVEAIDFSNYELLLLGGDLAYLTSEDSATMNHVNSIYTLSDPNTLWALGNHDYSNPNLITTYTNRPLHYTYHKNGITFIVHDSEIDSCSILNSQLDLLNDVTDTISSSSHLVILTHKLIWMHGNAILEPLIPQVSNAGVGPAGWQIHPNNFYSEVYSKLTEVQNRGVQVICVAGDIGFQAKEFEFRFDSGIQLLASGIHANSAGNKGLVFQHYKKSRVLTWKFVPLADL